MKDCLYRQAVLSACLFGGSAQKHSVCKVKFFFELLGNIASLFCCKYVIRI